MHYSGIGTYESCSLANTFIRHVAEVGEITQNLKTAYNLMTKGKILQATMMYMELADSGLPTAMLNAGILLNKYNVFPQEYSYLA